MSRTAPTPLATRFASVSLNRTGISFITEIAAIPAPMKPVPSTAMRSTGLAGGFAPSTPDSFLRAVVA